MREDPEQRAKCDETMELLLAAGYFRVRIKGLSDFDKVIIPFARRIVHARARTGRSSAGSRGAFKHATSPWISTCSIKRTPSSVKRCMLTARSPYRISRRSFSALTERIVLVLTRMKYPHKIEPHQIQGEDFRHIFPVVQWLVKRVFERRAEMGDFNRAYTLSQYAKQFGDSTEKVNTREKETNPCGFIGRF